MAMRKITSHLLSVLAAVLLSTPAGAGRPSLESASSNDQGEYAVAYQINPAHSGSIKFKSGFRLPLTKLWTTTIKGSEVALTYPLIAEDKVFFSEGSDGITYALSLTTGAVIWTNNSGANYIGPAYDNGLVFLLRLDGLLEAVWAKSGKLKWSLQLGSISTSPPTAGHGLIYTDSGLYAVDEDTGNIVWYGDPVNASTAGATALGDTGVYIPGACFYAKLDWKTGVTDWEYQSCSDYGVNLGSSVYRAGRVYIQDDTKGDFILDANTGGYLGTFNCNYQRPADPPAFVDVKGQEYGICLFKGSMYAWNASTGATAWSFLGDGSLITPPIVVNGLVFAGSSSGNIYALAASTGAVKWSDNIGYPGPSSFAAGQGTLIAVRSTNGASSTVTAYVPK